MQRNAGARQQLAAPAEINRVIPIAPICRAAPAKHEPLGPEATEMVGDEILRQARL
jgi:hypothetical protein